MPGLSQELGFDSGRDPFYLSAGRTRMRCRLGSTDDDGQPDTGFHPEMLAWGGVVQSSHWLQKTSDGGDGMMAELPGMMRTALGTLTRSGSDQNYSQQAGMRKDPTACPQQAWEESATPLLSFPRYPCGRRPKIPPHDQKLSMHHA